MFRKSAVLSFILIVSSTTFFVWPHTSEAAGRNSTLVQLQIKILLLKIEQLRLQLAELKAPKLIEPLNTEAVNNSVRQAVVNILCENTGASPFKSISGSGVIIDKRGIILTNAHIGQYFLVKDYPRADAMNCVIRAGSPASPAYEARLMYLPPAWIQNNPKTIRTSGATGTGEDDYAFLAVTLSRNSLPLPASFPYVPIDDTVALLQDNYPVLLASYPGELAGSFMIQNSLFASSAITNVSKGYYFETNPVHDLDLFDVSGTLISQAGSSGGAVVSLITGKLIGIIATATEGVTTGLRELRAVNLAHINRSISKYTGQTLANFLAQAPDVTAANFERTEASAERNLLIQ